MTNPTVPRAALGPLEPLAKGGTAVLYRVPSYQPQPGVELVYKAYKQKIRDKAGPALLPGLQAIVSLPGRLPSGHRAVLEDRTIWPTQVVIDESSAATGILMRLIPGEYFQAVKRPSGKVSNEPRELGLLFNGDEDAVNRGLPVLTMHTRILVCSQVARAFGLAHKADVVLGDVSARNVVYTAPPGGTPTVLLVDCDSVRVRGSRSPFGAQPHTPRWEPPEALHAKQRLAVAKRSGQTSSDRLSSFRSQITTQSKVTDVYKFGLIVVRVLDYGRGRSVNRDPAKAKRVIGQHVGREAVQLLDATLAPDPASRPSMRDWYVVLGGGKREAPASQSHAARARASANAGPPASSANWNWVDGHGWVRR